MTRRTMRKTIKLSVKKGISFALKFLFCLRKPLDYEVNPEGVTQNKNH